MQIGLMNNPMNPLEKEILAIGDAGYEFVDLTIEGPHIKHSDIDRIKSFLQRYGLFIVGHTDPCLPYAYPIKGIRDASIKELERCASIFSALGARVMNIHPCYTFPPAMKANQIELNIEALSDIVEMAGSFKLTVAFENFRAPFDSVSTFKRILAKVPGLKIHLDFGHGNMGLDDGIAFCKEFGEEIVHVHLSDNLASGDHHIPLGSGTIEWRNAIQTLKSIGYNGAITLEIFCRDDSVRFEYLEISRKLLQRYWG